MKRQRLRLPLSLLLIPISVSGVGTTVQFASTEYMKNKDTEFTASSGTIWKDELLKDDIETSGFQSASVTIDSR